MGRPSSYTKKKGDVICERLAMGESLETILETKGMPSYRTVMYWLAGENGIPVEEAPVFVQKYARAREMADDRVFDSMVERIKDTPLDRESIQRMRLQIDAEKWTLAKKRPKKYGDKLEVNADTQMTIRVIREDTVRNGTKTLSDGGKHGRTPPELESASKPSHPIEAK